MSISPAAGHGVVGKPVPSIQNAGQSPWPCGSLMAGLDAPVLRLDQPLGGELGGGVATGAVVARETGRCNAGGDGERPAPRVRRVGRVGGVALLLVVSPSADPGGAPVARFQAPGRGVGRRPRRPLELIAPSQGPRGAPSLGVDARGRANRILRTGGQRDARDEEHAERTHDARRRRAAATHGADGNDRVEGHGRPSSITVVAPSTRSRVALDPRVELDRPTGRSTGSRPNDHGPSAPPYRLKTGGCTVRCAKSPSTDQGFAPVCNGWSAKA